MDAKDLREITEDIRSNKGFNIEKLFEVIIEKYPDLKKQKGIDESIYISELLLEISKSVTSETQASTLKVLAEAHPELSQVSQEVTRIISRNNEWVLKNKEPLCTWLDSA